MTNKVFVGNLPWSMDTEGFSTFLTEEGYTYRSVKVIVDQQTQKSRGFAFVEFESVEAAAEAITALTGTVCGGRALFANEAKDSKTGGSNRPKRAQSEERAERSNNAPAPRREKSNKPQRGRDDFGW